MAPAAPQNGLGSLTRLRELRPRLADAERRLATYILRHPRQVLDSSITLVADRARVSEATVVRLCRRIGCRGYQDLRIRLAADLVVPPRQLYQDIEPGDDGPAVKQKVFALSVRALEETLDVLDDAALERAAAAIAAARRVDFYGVGASGIVALDAQQKFLRIGIEAQAFVDPHLQAASAALLRRGDVAVGISESGSTRDTVHALGVARAAGAVTVAVTRYGPSPIVKVAAVRLHTLSRESGIRGGALASRIAQLAVIDALMMTVALRRYDVTLAALRATRDAVAEKKF
ncbi:MAG: MurR/RpiR family transcriptional regulator [Armatimonadota bacterium]|nr:MurR/RpiR family transcriptional regulator [Armatimonadota bacterium]MDR7453544.1 MurR/RpiR family transcriptional regulator [Armatimonadota bacterium]MDR7455682.1 MurR/RpiR family transcriptional regulator [Armatimonadota bacterium]MDR7497471.1 MurR/RpiR family transcriptional regulator [Armatimonadota bacterium]